MPKFKIPKVSSFSKVDSQIASESFVALKDELYQSQNVEQSQYTSEKNQTLEKFVSCLSSIKITQILQKFKPVDSFQQMSWTELQVELCNHSKQAAPDDPLSYVKDLTCLVETVAYSEGEDNDGISNDEEAEVLSLIDDLPCEVAPCESQPLDSAQQVTLNCDDFLFSLS